MQQYDIERFVQDSICDPDNVEYTKSLVDKCFRGRGMFEKISWFGGNGNNGHLNITEAAEYMSFLVIAMVFMFDSDNKKAPYDVIDALVEHILTTQDLLDLRVGIPESAINIYSYNMYCYSGNPDGTFEMGTVNDPLITKYSMLTNSMYYIFSAMLEMTAYDTKNTKKAKFIKTKQSVLLELSRQGFVGNYFALLNSDRYDGYENLYTHPLGYDINDENDTCSVEDGYIAIGKNMQTFIQHFIPNYIEDNKNGGYVRLDVETLVSNHVFPDGNSDSLRKEFLPDTTQPYSRVLQTHFTNEHLKDKTQGRRFAKEYVEQKKISDNFTEKLNKAHYGALFEVFNNEYFDDPVETLDRIPLTHLRNTSRVKEWLLSVVSGENNDDNNTTVTTPALSKTKRKRIVKQCIEDSRKDKTLDLALISIIMLAPDYVLLEDNPLAGAKRLRDKIMPLVTANTMFGLGDSEEKSLEVSKMVYSITNDEDTYVTHMAKLKNLNTNIEIKNVVPMCSMFDNNIDSETILSAYPTTSFIDEMVEDKNNNDYFFAGDTVVPVNSHGKPLVRGDAFVVLNKNMFGIFIGKVGNSRHPHMSRVYYSSVIIDDYDKLSIKDVTNSSYFFDGSCLLAKFDSNN